MLTEKYIHFCLWLCFLMVIGSAAFSQNTPDKYYYVIIGGFQSEQNAMRFSEAAQSAFDRIQYALNTDRGIFYVYTFKTDKRTEAYAMGAQARAIAGYSDAWVYYGLLEPKIDKDTEPPVAMEVVSEELLEPEDVIEEQTEPEVEEAVVEEEVIKEDEHLFRFSLMNVTTGKEVMGQVFIAEQRESNTFDTYNGNEQVLIKKPANKDQTYSVVVNAPGYLPVETTLDYAVYAGGSTDREVLSNITIPLEQARKGKFIEFNNVSFLINSALLTSNSKDELDAFVQLLQENPKYKIRVHGHCNGKFDRSALIKADGSEYFDRSEGNEELTLSPKKLTKYRAEIVKDYLVDQGIASKRVKTIGVGGQAMLFPANGPLSKLNDRIEIEVIRGK